MIKILFNLMNNKKISIKNMYWKKLRNYFQKTDQRLLYIILVLVMIKETELL